jgi:hypothetical protein
MFSVPVSTAQSLELVAQEENFPNWDAACAVQFQPVKHVTPSNFITRISQRGMHIVARSGSGKHWHALAMLLDNLYLGKTVVVVDLGRSYYHFARSVGGTYLSLLPSGEWEISRFGKASITVYDFDLIGHRGAIAPNFELPNIPSKLATTDGFLVIDEVDSIEHLWREAPAFLERVSQSGASFCLIAQTDEDAPGLMSCSVPLLMTIRLKAESRSTIPVCS